MNKQQFAEEEWLRQRVIELLPNVVITANSHPYDDCEWRYVRVYLDGQYAGGFGFDLDAGVWIRTEPSTGNNRSKNCGILCPLHLRQKVRHAVNQAIAELAEQRLAA